MTEFLIPQGSGEAEFTEKRSRFIGNLWRVSSEAEARSCMAEVAQRHYDARHHCWCYRVREGNLERCSDDGEPQGTAGTPMLEVLRRERVTNVCCVVTRYFGGVLLGAGGLTRAYVRGAKNALDAAGLSVVRQHTRLRLVLPYAQFEQLKLELLSCEGTMGSCDYAADITMEVLLLDDKVKDFTDAVVQLTAGLVMPEFLCTELHDTPL